MKEFKPAFSDNNTAVAMAVNDRFVPYLAVLLSSIIANSSADYNYDIFILSDDITDESCENLKSLIIGKANFSIRFIDPSPLIVNYDFHVRSFWSVQTYFRLVLPEILTSYEKVLYLDSDMVVCDDISIIYQEDISDYLIGACVDVDTAGLYNGYDSTKKKYMDEVLKLENPYEYFQAGTILFNLKKFREEIKTTEVLQLATSRKWQLLDQDVLNVVCKEKVKYIDIRWNIMVDMYYKRRRDIISLSPKWMQEEYENGRANVAIIHYAGPEKPWNNKAMDYGEVFWEYASISGYHSELEERNINFLKARKNIYKRVKTLTKKMFDSLRANGIKNTFLKVCDIVKNK